MAEATTTNNPESHDSPSPLQRAMDYVVDWRLTADVGAGQGHATALLASRSDRVLAFEPDPNCLMQFVDIPAAERVKLLLCGLGNQNGSVGIENGRIAVDNTGWFPISRLDDYPITELGCLNLDVSGFEYQVLRGAEQVLRRHQPIVVINEQGLGQKHFGEPERYASIRFLEGLGATVLDWIGTSMILGWPDAVGRVRKVADRPMSDRLSVAVDNHSAGDLQGAEIAYRMLLRAEPECADFWHLLACVYCELGEIDRALVLMDRVLELAPDETIYQQSLTFFRHKAGYETSAPIAAGARDIVMPAHEHTIAGPHAPIPADSAVPQPAAAAQDPLEHRLDASHQQAPPTPQTPLERGAENTVKL